MSALIAAANKVERATGPDRFVDRAIAEALGEMWFVDANNEIKIPAHYTASMDHAIRLVPEGWFWRAGRTSSYQAWAVVQRYHPDHCDTNTDEFLANRRYDQPEWTPILALLHAALRARAKLEEVANVKRDRAARAATPGAEGSPLSGGAGPAEGGGGRGAEASEADAGGPPGDGRQDKTETAQKEEG